VILDAPLPLSEVVRRLDAAMPEAGADRNPEYAGLANSGGPVNRYSFTWYYNSDALRDDYRISLNVPFNVENPESIELIFRNDSTDNFTEKEWRIFFDWKDRLVSSVFPEASGIEISRHPAEFTDVAEIESIADSLGVERPARLSEKSSHESL